MLWTPDQDWEAYQASAPNVTNVTPAQNSKGSYQAILGAAVAFDTYMLEVRLGEGYSGAQARDIICDIGIDYAGGSSYSVFIADLLGSCASAVCYRFPLFIPAGATLAARGSVNNATVGSFRAGVRLFQKPRRPELCRFGFTVDSFGVVAASSRGTSITPGASGAEGSWTDISGGTTSHDYFWWEMGMGVNDSTMAARNIAGDLAYGDTTNKTILLDGMFWETTAAETISKGGVGNEAMAPSGNTIYARMSNSGTNDAAYSAMAYGVRC